MTTLKVFALVWQTMLLPVMEPGWAGRELTATAKVCGVEFPQALLAKTEMVPPVAPAVTVILLLVLVPVQVPGKVHV